MPTFLELKQATLRRLAWADDKVGLLPIPLSSTAKSANLLSLRDTKLARGTHSAGNYNGRHIEIASQPTKVDSGTDVNENPFAAGDTTLTVDDGTKFSVGDAIQIDDEILAVTAIATHNLTVTRGIQGTTDAAHDDSSDIYLIGPAVGEIAAVDVAGFDLTDKLITSPAFTGMVRTGANYLLYPKLLVPETLGDAINNTLKATELPHLWAPSLVPDSDFDSDDISTYWQDVGTPGAVIFATSAVGAFSLFGERVLHVYAATDSGVQSLTFDVHPNESFLVSAFVREMATAKIRVELRESSSGDVVDYADIESAALTEARFRSTWVSALTSTEDSANIAFVAQETSAVNGFHVAAPVIVQSDRRRAYAAPSWLTRENQVGDAFYLPAGRSGENADNYVPLGGSLNTLSGVRFLRSDRALTPLRIEFAPNISRGPVFFECRRPFSELSALTDTTPCDEEFAAAKAAARILKNRGDEGWWVHDRDAEKRARRMGYSDRQLRSESPTVLV